MIGSRSYISIDAMAAKDQAIYPFTYQGGSGAAVLLPERSPRGEGYYNLVGIAAVDVDMMWMIWW